LDPTGHAGYAFIRTNPCEAAAMTKIAVFVTWLIPSVGLAQPVLEILSPAANTCVGNAAPLFETVAAGGDAPPLRDIPLRLRLSEPQGRPIDLRIEVDGVEVADGRFVPAAAGVAEETDEFAVRSDLILDGERREIRVTATSNGQSRNQTVAFKLDRHYPRVTFSDAALDQLGGCFPGGPPAAAYEVEDDLDATPAVQERFVENGCIVERRVRVEDDCGNAQEVAYGTRRAPAPGSLAVSFENVAEGERVSRANLVYGVDGPQNCIISSSAEMRVNGAEPVPYFAGEELSAPGDYVVTVRMQACGGQEISGTRRFTILQRPVADAGGPYEGVQGERIRIDGSGSFAPAELGGIVEWGWDLNGDGFFDADEGDEAVTFFDSSVGDGEHFIFLRTRAGNGSVEFDSALVVVTDVDPTCDAGGPYEATQGEQIQLDGSNSQPGHESDPIRVWDWDFGDNRFPQRAAGLEQPFHTWGQQGEYLVRLRVEDPDSSCEDTAIVVVGDVEPRISGIGALNAANLVEGTPVTFTAGNTAPGSDSDPITLFAWTFGVPGGEAEGQFLRNPRHTYEDQGEYEVCLAVSDPDSEVSECFQVRVADLQPTATFTGPRLGSEGEELFFDASLSFAGGDADPIAAYVWDFGDGTPEVRVDAETPITSHVFRRDGDLTVRLFVEDEDSRSEVFEQQINIIDAVPEASAQVVYAPERDSGDEGVPVRFDARASAPGAPSDPITSYRWDFNDGSEPAEGANLAETTHAFPDQGTYRVRLTVTDGDGSQVFTELNVRIENVAPTVEVTVDDANIEQGVPATFRAEVTDAAGDPPRVTWDMGDGSPAKQGDVVEHAYAERGEFEITVQVDDGDGGTAEATLRVSVNRAAPRIDAPRNIAGVEGEPLEFTVTVTAATLDENTVDELVQVFASNLPPGATAEVSEGEDAAARRTVTVRWTPSYTAAGRYNIRVSAQAVSTTSRSLEIPVTIAEGGTPLLAAVGGTGSRGVVTMYEYGYDGVRQIESFTALREVEVGVGAGGAAVSPDGGWLFVASPGSGTVAVISTRGEARRVRSIPTGALTSSVVWGGDHVWAVVGGTNEIVQIDPIRMKVVARASLAPLQGAVDLAWLPEGFGGEDDGPHLAVVAQRSGDVALVDPEQVHAGRDLVVARKRIGGRPQRVVAVPGAGPDSDALVVSDAKTRRVVRVSMQDLAGNQGGEPTSTSLDFAAHDLSATGDIVWAATRGGLVRIAPNGDKSVRAELASTSVAPLDPRIRPGGGLIVATAEEIANLAGEMLSRQLGAPGSRVRRLAAFIALE
jgi:PKD repeat protein